MNVAIKSNNDNVSKIQMLSIMDGYIYNLNIYTHKHYFISFCTQILDWFEKDSLF